MSPSTVSRAWRRYQESRAGQLKGINRLWGTDASLQEGYWFESQFGEGLVSGFVFSRFPPTIQRH